MRHFFAALTATLTIISATPTYADLEGSYFAVIVSDIEASQQWYESTLGLKPTSTLSEDGRYIIVNLQKPGLFVELLELQSAHERPEHRFEGAFKVGILVSDLEKFVASLPDSVTKPEVINDQTNKLRLVQLRDPDGNIVQVMELSDTPVD